MISIFYRICSPTLIVLLDGEVEDYLSRIRKRGRDSESTIDAEYLLRLGQRYEEWFESIECEHKVRIDTGQHSPEDIAHKIVELVTP